MDNEQYHPVPHTREDDAKLFSDPAFKAAYDALEEEYTALGEMIQARKQAGLTQEGVAARMGTTKSAISRLEASLRSDRGSPSFSTLRKYAHACGKRLVVKMV
ncbi:MAG: helix-turn-helix transcriptional regulator [Sulfuricellaceae bacterium]|nr:helix-turn-helix transcriptional regulator [Sulfuricellaceae bacterium]